MEGIIRLDLGSKNINNKKSKEKATNTTLKISL